MNTKLLAELKKVCKGNFSEEELKKVLRATDTHNRRLSTERGSKKYEKLAKAINSFGSSHTEHLLELLYLLPLKLPPRKDIEAGVIGEGGELDRPLGAIIVLTSNPNCHSYPQNKPLFITNKENQARETNGEKGNYTPRYPEGGYRKTESKDIVVFFKSAIANKRAVSGIKGDLL